MFRLLAALVLAALVGARADAAVIMNYTFTNQSLANQATASVPTVTNVSNFGDVGVTDTLFNRGSGNFAASGTGWPSNNTEGRYYRFSFTVANGTATINGFSADIASDFRTQFLVKLFDSDSNTLVSTLFARQDAPNPDTNFMTRSLGTLGGNSLVPIVLDPGNYEFRLIGTNANGAGRELRFDNVRVDVEGNPVPEPATLAVFGALAAGAGLTYRRRRAV